MRRAVVRRRLLAGLLVVPVAATGAMLLDNRSGEAQEAAGPVGIEAQVGPGNGAQLLGSAPRSGDRSEAWALNVATGPVTVDGQPLPRADRARDEQQYLLRYRASEGWRYVQTPLGTDGAPFAGKVHDGRVTTTGGLLLVGGDAPRSVLIRDAQGPTRALPTPDSTVLRPGSGSIPDETFSATAMAARDRGDGRTEGFVGLVGAAVETGVGHWDGERWTRELVCVADDGSTPPAGCSVGETLNDARYGLTAVSLATVEGGGAWMVARAHADAHRGLLLFERVTDGPAPRWRLRDVGAPRFAADATPADGVTAVEPLPGGSAATATADGVWVDGRFRHNGTERNVTLFVRAGGATTSWCDGGLCDRPLGVAFRDDQRSQAWAGGAHGTRVIGPVGSSTQRYASFDGERFTVAAAFGSIGRGIAFAGLDEGWLGNVHVTRDRPASPLAAWAVPVRRPLTAIANAPGAVGDLSTPAVAVGLGGSIVRYTPGQGWDSEVRLTGAGVARDDLRGVAWPEPSTAYAVGDDGAMWRWRKVTGLWESDPAAPFDFAGHLTAIAFEAGNPDRGFAVGRGGTILRYGKSWEPMALPAELATRGPNGGPVDVLGVAFAGGQGIAAAGAGGVLVENGAGWVVDEGAKALLGENAPEIYAVAGLPDGGAVAAGHRIVLIRDSATAPWRVSDQPLHHTAFAAAAYREGDRVRAILSVSPPAWPTTKDLLIAPPDPASPTPRAVPLSLPVDGYLLRETATGWRDEERTMLGSPTTERARKSDPVLAILSDDAGRGWTVGGWSGANDGLERGPGPDEAPLEDAQTASVGRYDPAGPTGSSNVGVAAPEMPTGKARLLVGGHGQCAATCADLAPLDTMPDRTLIRAVSLASTLGAAANGPQALAYTGGRSAVVGDGSAPNAASEANRFAQLLAGGALPVFAAVAHGEATGGTSGAYEQAFAGYPAPFGGGSAAPGTRAVMLGEPGAPGRARTHYAVDIDTAGGGPVRLVVIDNATGSLQARNGAGHPQQDQAAWLRGVLRDAKERGIPAVVAGNRNLVSGAVSDAAAVVGILRDEGASAYVYDGAGNQSRGTLGGAVPSFASGTLGYRPQPDTLGMGVPGLLLLEVDSAARDARTNRAPVGVRLIPVIDDLAIEAVDGRLLNRSQPALFQGLGRRPRAGANWTTGQSPEASGADPYVQLPSPLCSVATRERCATTRIDPEVTFRSSDPDIVDFVRTDPASTNPRKPYIDPKTDKPVPDSRSGLVCPFNAGTATISISSGGLTYSTTVTVRDGSVLRPCGTVPLNPSRFPASPGSSSTPPPPPSTPPASGSNPMTSVSVPPPAAPPGPAPPTPPSATPTAAKALIPVMPAMVAPLLAPPLAVPPPPGAAAPAPPPGTSGASINVPVSQPVTQAERQREEEVAEESSKAYARYEPTAAVNRGASPGDATAVVAAVLLLAIGGGTAIGGRHRARTRYAYARDPQYRPRRPR